MYKAHLIAISAVLCVIVGVAGTVGWVYFWYTVSNSEPWGFFSALSIVPIFLYVVVYWSVRT